MMDPRLVVKINLGKTLNIGNYESLRIDVSVEDEFISSSYDTACEQVYQAVAGELHKRIEETRKRFS